MVLTRRMVKERATGNTNDGPNTSSTGPAIQVSNTDPSMCSAAVIYGDAVGANVNGRASSRRGGTKASGAPKPQISRENNTIDARTPAASRRAGAAKRNSKRKLTPSKTVTKPGGLNLVTSAYSPDESTNSPPGKKRRRDEGDSNKENAAVASRDTPSKRRDEISTKSANKNLPETVEAPSSRRSSHRASSSMETSDDVVFAYELLKLSGRGRNQFDVSPSPAAVLSRSPEKKSISNGMTAVDNGVVQRLLELFDLKKAEDRSEQPEVANASSYLYPALFPNRPNRVLYKEEG
ncbi:hypothetical protein A7U60_g2557 [Sanghuangporus baumii]|uniref:Uncharacterized protein n=1 Tax=Sanghuangporus baumii TaxID=108892 RepID=A0A9Q5I222_SANBA|nr:hypothetical protein A7U60_g2557 [Sanghuangporus baumii]